MAALMLQHAMGGDLLALQGLSHSLHLNHWWTGESTGGGGPLPRRIESLL